LPQLTTRVLDQQLRGDVECWYPHLKFARELVPLSKTPKDPLLTQVFAQTPAGVTTLTLSSPLERDAPHVMQSPIRHSPSALALLVVVLSAKSAFAQTASQLTPRSFTPSTDNQHGTGVAISGSPDGQAPPGADRLFIRLIHVELQGDQLIDGGPLEAITKKLTDPAGVSGAQIFAAARELEKAYAAAGYVLVRVAVPPQTLTDGGTLDLVLIDGYIERVEIREVPKRVRRRVAALTDPLIGKRALKLAELERRVLLAGDVPGTVVRSSLAPGSVFGATVLIIEAKQRPVSTELGADNSPGSAFGGYSTSVGLNANSIMGLGEQMYLSAQGDPGGGFLGRFPRNRILASGFVAPVGQDGLTLNVEGVEARTDPTGSLTPGFDTTDLFRRLSSRLRFPWLRSRSANFATELVFDAENEEENAVVGAVTTPLSLDRLRVFRFNASADYLNSAGAVFFGRAAISAGSNGLGARSAAEAAATNIPLSRQGADAEFSKIELSLGYNQQLLQHLAVSLSAQSQDSLGHALAQAEQIGLVGRAALSAFDAGIFQGDSGYVARAEISSPSPLASMTNGQGLSGAPYLYLAEGRLWLTDPTAVEARSTRAGSYGVGLRLGGPPQMWPGNGSIAIEYGRQRRSDHVPEQNRFNVTASVTF
jgi:hemolysin activation/secretion protein